MTTPNSQNQFSRYPKPDILDVINDDLSRVATHTAREIQDIIDACHLKDRSDKIFVGKGGNVICMPRVGWNPKTLQLPEGVLEKKVKNRNTLLREICINVISHNKIATVDDEIIVNMLCLIVNASGAIHENRGELTQLYQSYREIETRYKGVIESIKENPNGGYSEGLEAESKVLYDQFKDLLGIHNDDESDQVVAGCSWESVPKWKQHINYSRLWVISVVILELVLGKKDMMKDFGKK